MRRFGSPKVPWGAAAAALAAILLTAAALTPALSQDLPPLRVTSNPKAPPPPFVLPPLPCATLAERIRLAQLLDKWNADFAKIPEAEVQAEKAHAWLEQRRAQLERDEAARRPAAEEIDSDQESVRLAQLGYDAKVGVLATAIETDQADAAAFNKLAAAIAGRKCGPTTEGPVVTPPYAPPPGQIWNPAIGDPMSYDPMPYAMPAEPPTTWPVLPCMTSQDYEDLEALLERWEDDYARLERDDENLGWAQEAYHYDVYLAQHAGQPDVLGLETPTTADIAEAKNHVLNLEWDVDADLYDLEEDQKAYEARVAEIRARKCPDQDHPVTPPHAPPPVPAPPPHAPPEHTLVNCPACQKIADSIAYLDGRIDNIRHSIAGLQKYADLKDPRIQAAIKDDEAKLAALEKERDGEIKRLEDCLKHCIPQPPEHSMAPPRKTSMEDAVLAEVNAARTDPHAYAQALRDGPQTAETADAIAFLEHQSPLPPLKLDDRLAHAAVGHAADDGPKGSASHVGSDGKSPNQRAQALGVWSSVYAEVISVGEKTPRGVVRQLILDQPGPNHPHRADLFDPMLMYAGVGCGGNAQYGSMCVIDLSADIAD